MQGEQELLLLLLSCLVLIIAPLWYLYRSKQVGTRFIARFAFWTAIVALGVAGIALTTYYRLPGILMFVIAVLYPIVRLVMDDALKGKKQERNLTVTGNASLLRSAWLELRIDHDSGKFSGNVLQGKMQNWHLHEMDGYDLMNLRSEILPHDQLAVVLLDVWLDKEGPVHWRRDFGKSMLTTPTPPIAVQSRSESAAILGIAPDSKPEMVAAARQKLENLIGQGGEHSTLLDMIACSAKLLATPEAA